MSFNDIKGQQKTIGILKKFIQKNRVSQAYLFYGPPGVGKYKTALTFSKVLNCRNLELDSCEGCISCRKISNYNHPDVYVINSDGEKSSIKIEDIRKLQNNISLKSYESDRNICIIRNADKMTAEANNSLLKSLENVSYNTIIILTASNLQNIFPTVISRCLIIRFAPLNLEIIKEILSKKKGISGVSLDYVAKLAEGSLEKAYMFIDQKVFRKRDKLINLLSGEKRRLLFYKPKYNSREDIFFILDIILNWYRDILLLKNNLRGLVINQDKKGVLEEDSENLDTNKIVEIIDNIIQTRRNIKNNANIKLAMHNNMRTICEIEEVI